MQDARVALYLTAYWIHRHDILRVVVVDGFEIAKLSFDSILRTQKVGHLNVNCLFTPRGNKVDFSSGKYYLM